MSAPILTTKLFIPRPRPGLVPRPRLIERLNEGLPRQGRGFAHRLTLVSAPAGFGKTTLLSSWLHQLSDEQSGLPAPQPPGSSAQAAWLSLDERDNDPARFLAYLVAALQTVQPHAGEAALAALQPPQPAATESILSALINDIAGGPASGEPTEEAPGRPVALILDDYHVISAQPIHDALTFLLDHLPPNLHLVIATRSDPPLPLSRLRGRGQLIELRSSDLRFTPDEAAAFLNARVGLRLSADDIVALETRTEGWIVGLQMAALWLQGQDSKRIAHSVSAFTGSHRYVLDYLTDEVLAQQPEGVRTFLLQTATLHRLTGSLCDAVVGRGDGGEMLQRLDAANLFIVPLDAERRWYRYHHLFADLLRKRLSQTQPDLLPALYRRASEWYENTGLIAEAVSYALQAGDVERAARLVGGAGLAMLEHSELRVVERWLDTLVEEEMRSEPWLRIARAWISAFTARLDAVEPLVRTVEQAAAGCDSTSVGPTLGESEWQHLRGHIAAVRACVALLEGDRLRTAQLARDALELLPADDAMTRAWAAMVLGLNLHQRGDVQAADQAFSEALTTSRATGDSHVAVLVLCNTAAVQGERGELRKAVDSLHDALQVADAYAARAGRELPVSAYAHMALGSLLLEWNDLEAAQAHLKEGVRLSQRWGEPLRLSGARLGLAEILQATGDAQGALEALAHARHAAGRLSPWLSARVATVEASVCLRQGDTATAFRWADAHRDAAPPYLTPYERWGASLLRARIDLARGRPDEALSLLRQVYQEAQPHAGQYAVIGSLALQALALRAQGKLDQALTALERALTLAEPEGYVRTFIDEGEPMAALLRAAASRGMAVDYVSELLAAVGEVAAPSALLIEPLSERELEVLRLLAAGLSNREIAAELFLAVGTVKKHTSNIYGKLNVHTRTQAVGRARELSLI